MDIGVIGIGAMGLPIALHLAECGHRVVVRDVDPAREALAAGCVVARSAADLARQAQLVVVCVVDAAQTGEVLFGIDGVASAQPRPQAVLLCPTIGPADTEAFAQRLAGLGVEAIDAPMSGGPRRARDGSMSLMVACADAVFARWRAVLQQMASALVHVGARIGDGARTKLVNNLLAATHLAAMGEAMRLAEAIGLDLVRTLEVIERSSGQSWIGSERMRRALAAGDATPAIEVQAQIALLAKDSALAMDLARQAAQAMPVGSEAARRFARAVAAGWAGRDDAELWRFKPGDAAGTGS